jgi:hypothetical protein
MCWIDIALWFFFWTQSGAILWENNGWCLRLMGKGPKVLTFFPLVMHLIFPSIFCWTPFLPDRHQFLYPRFLAVCWMLAAITVVMMRYKNSILFSWEMSNTTSLYKLTLIFLGREHYNIEVEWLEREALTPGNLTDRRMGTLAMAAWYCDAIISMVIWNVLSTDAGSPW